MDEAMKKKNIKDNGKIWFCKKCSVVEDDETRYARHIRTHLNGYRYRNLKKPKLGVSKIDPVKRKIPEPTRIEKKLSSDFLSIMEDDSNVEIPSNITDLLNSSIMNEDICQRLVDPTTVMPSIENDDFTFDMDDFLFSNDSPVKFFPDPNLKNSKDDSILDIPLNKKNDLSIFDSKNNITYELIIADESSPQSLPTKTIVENKVESKIKFICEICQMKFSQEFYLHRHLSKHARDYVCKACSYSFARRETLITHRCDELKKLKSAENNIENQDEEILNRSEKNNEKLLRHLVPFQRKHPNKKTTCTDNKTSLNSNPEEKDVCTKKGKNNSKYKCDICEAVFTSKIQLSRHEIVHEKEKYYVCIYCNAVVKHKFSMRRHLKTIHSEYRQEWDTEDFISNVCCKNDTTQKKTLKKKANEQVLNKDIQNKPQIKQTEQIEKICDKFISPKIHIKDSIISLGITEDSLIGDFNFPPILGEKIPTITDSNDTVLGFSNHFLEDIGQVSFQALSVPGSICKALDSKENSPIKSFNYPNSPLKKTPEKISNATLLEQNINEKSPVIPLIKENLTKSPTDFCNKKTELKETNIEAKEISITDDTLINDIWFQQLDAIMNETEIQSDNINILSNEDAEVLENMVHLIADNYQLT